MVNERIQEPRACWPVSRQKSLDFVEIAVVFQGDVLIFASCRIDSDEQIGLRTTVVFTNLPIPCVELDLTDVFKAVATHSNGMSYA